MLFQATIWVLCHSVWWTVGHGHGQLIPVWRLESWEQARQYCQMHFVDLVVANTEEQLGTLLGNAERETGSFWIGLRYRDPSGWSWVDGKALTYSPWYRLSRRGDCGTIETSLPGAQKLLPRICMEKRPFLCQGPVPPLKIEVGFVGTACVSLSWPRPAPMQGVQYSFNVSYVSASQGSRKSYLSNSNSTIVCDLTAGDTYNFSVSTVMGRATQSDPVSVSVLMRLYPPVNVMVESIGSNSVTLSWSSGSNRSCLYNVSYYSLDGSHSGFSVRPELSSHVTIGNLWSQMEYIVSIMAVSLSGAQSVPVTVFLNTCSYSMTLAAITSHSMPFVFLMLILWLLHQIFKTTKNDDSEEQYSRETMVDVIHQSS
ncbi:uncharacterized protein [Paramormyrops kingsleyae]|uniref:uncharacterized protein n=1 Tax=Paramormyrops kingsleyae TaxID=1676925 RepID=UPI003B97BDE5